MESLPIKRRGVWKRVGKRVYLCATLGPEFDTAQRSLFAMSAAEGYAAQEKALKELECFLDELQDEAKSSLAPGERLMPRKSPGYGAMALSENDEIIEILDATRRIGVSATRAHLLAPSKSVTAVCEII